MAGLFTIRQWKLRGGCEVEFAGIGGIAGVLKWSSGTVSRLKRVKRVIPGTCNGNVDGRAETQRRNDSKKLVDNRWLAKIKREYRECNDLQRENRERRHLRRENVECDPPTSWVGTKADFMSQQHAKGGAGTRWCVRCFRG